MAISFSLIAKAVELATKVFVTVRESSAQNPATDNTGLVDVIEKVSRNIDSLASDIAGEVKLQIERQQLEKLSGQAKVVSLALELGNEAMLGTAVASISEQIEYSRLRLAEGKLEWFGPWMIAESVRIEALRIMATSPRALAVVQRETLNFRINILNHVGALLIGSTSDAWLKISDFVEGRNEDVLKSLNSIELLQFSDIEPDLKTKKKSPASPPSAPAKTILEPAMGWPFPTSSRP